MHPKHRVPTHRGEVLLEEFLVPLGITQVVGTTPAFRLNLPANHDLAKSRPTRVVHKLCRTD